MAKSRQNTASKQNKGGRATRTRNLKRPLPLGLAALGLFALVAITVYALASNQGPTNVESFMHLHGLAVPPWAPDEVYVSTHQGLIKIDAEGTWRVVSERPNDFMGFQANPTEEGVLYSSGHPAPGSNLPNPVGFMVSRDAGKTWQITGLRGQVDFHVMAVQPSNGDVIYGYSGGLYRSLDAGKSWERLDADLTQLGDVFALAVDPQDADTILVGSRTGLWRSPDAGESWEPLIPQVPVTAVAFAGDRLFAYAASPDAGLVSSTDNGASWSSKGFLVEGNDAIAYIVPHPTEEGTLYLGSFGQNIYKTSNNGQSWEQLAQGGIPQEHDHDNQER